MSDHHLAPDLRRDPWPSRDRKAQSQDLRLRQRLERNMGIRRDAQQGLSLEELATKYETTKTTVRRALGRTDHRGDPLTAREAEVLKLIATGMTTNEVAQHLHLSSHTIKAHAENIRGKLGTHTWAHSVARAISLGVLPGQDPTQAFRQGWQNGLEEGYRYGIMDSLAAIGDLRLEHSRHGTD